MTTAREDVKHLADLLRRERDGMTDFLLALADFDRGKRWRELGHTSLFYFLRRELGLSSGAAQYRKTAADLVQRYPEVAEALRSGKLCLSSVVELAKVLTPENVGSVLPRFFGLSSREAAFVAVSLRPAADPPRREIVTPLRPSPSTPFLLDAAGSGGFPQMAASATRSVLAVDAPGGPNSPSTSTSTEGAALGVGQPVRAPEPPMSVEASRRDAANRIRGPVKAVVVEPLDATWSRLHITVSRDFLAKLEAAKDALSHSHPRATADEVLEACMDLLIAERAKRKAALVQRPRKKVPPSNGSTVPAHVRRAIWKRAEGRCEWIFESGERCNSTSQLEFDHARVPKARGGRPTVENLALHCRPHNQLGARRVFGDKWMDRYVRKRQTSEGSENGTNRQPKLDATERR